MKKEVKCECNKYKFSNKALVCPQFNDATLEIIVNEMEKSNIPAFLSIILHNQKILSEKLNKLLESKK